MTRRAIFEDVGQARKQAPVAPARKREARGAIAVWLWTLAALVVAMIVVGGLTRLTDSGLSITVWDPVMGAVPPLSDADWDAAFEAYKTTTEYQEQNAWMTLEDFKPIYWWEWGHRQFGRLIGLVWAVGLLGFLVTRTIPQGWTWALVLPGLLGGVQGGIGWWMVASGLDRLDVASYRLATHLGLAFVILMLLVWTAMKIRLGSVETLQARRRRARAAAAVSWVLLAAVFLQVIAGALVAGIDAGRYHVDWPLMSGQWVPPDLLAVEPVWRNLVESPGMTQFVHRMLGYLVFLLAVVFLATALASGVPRLRRRGWLVLGAVTLQVAIGIATVMHASPLALASPHQAGAILVVMLVLAARFTALYPPQERLRA